MRSWDNRRANKARLLLRPAITTGMGGRWADIGCGDGIFTRLLLEWLTPGSTIVAVDKDEGALRRLTQELSAAQRAAVRAVQGDFTQPLPLSASSSFPGSTHGPFDGLLLANSLHFVRNKLPVLTHLVSWLRPGGTALIIEYNAAHGNWAVPHPFRDESCLQLMADAGLNGAYIVHREPSSFLGEIYTASAIKAEP